MGWAHSPSLAARTSLTAAHGKVSHCGGLGSQWGSRCCAYLHANPSHSARSMPCTRYCKRACTHTCHANAATEGVSDHAGSPRPTPRCRHLPPLTSCACVNSCVTASRSSVTLGILSWQMVMRGGGAVNRALAVVVPVGGRVVRDTVSHTAGQAHSEASTYTMDEALCTQTRAGLCWRAAGEA